jgi:hypothetical protein
VIATRPEHVHRAFDGGVQIEASGRAPAAAAIMSVAP